MWWNLWIWTWDDQITLGEFQLISPKRLSYLNCSWFMNRPLRIVGSIGPTNQIIITTVHNILVIEWQKAFVQSKGIWLPSQLRSKSTVEFCYGYLASEMSIFTPSELITDAGQCSVAIGCYKSNHHYNSQSADGAIAKSIFFCQGRKNLTKITIASCEISSAKSIVH